MSEQSTVTGPIIEAISALPGCAAWRQHSGRKNLGGRWIHLGPSGMPDIGAVVRGRAIFFEAKLPGKTPTEDQIRMHERLRRAGAEVHVVFSVAQALDVVRGVLAERKASE